MPKWSGQVEEDYDRTWRDDSDRLWRVRISFATLDGRVEPVGITVMPEVGHPWKPLNRETLKGLPVGRFVADARAEIVAKLRAAQADAPADAAAAIEADVQRYSNRRGSKLTEDILERVAAVYRDAYERGAPVVAAVAEAFYLSHSAAAKRIRAARDAGALDAVKENQR